MPGRRSDRPPRIPLFGSARPLLRVAVVVAWIRALLGATAAVTLGLLIDRAAAGNDTGLLIWGLVAALAVRALLAGVPPLTAAATAGRVEADLRRRVLDAVLRIGPWTGRRTGDVVGKATEGIDAVGALGGSFLPQLIGGMSIPLLLIGVLAFIDWPTALVLLVLLPAIPLLLRFMEKRFASVSARYRETADELAARFLDGIQGLRTLKALDRSQAYGDALAAESERLRAETMSLLKVNQLALLAVDSLFTLGTVVAAAAMAGLRLSAGAVSVGEAISIVLLGVMLIEPLTAIGRFFYVGAIGRASAAQIRDLLALVPPGEPTDHVEGGAPAGAIEIDGVDFSYPDGTRAIEDAGLRVRPGEKVALIGPSGSGKTTLAHLILGLLSPGRGTVRVGGRAMLVPQRPFLFHGSIADNLLLAKPDATDDEMWEALRAADLADLVAGRAEGLDIPVGERGLSLSGGEAQRLAIARAVLVDAAVVVLDEPTSNVDLDTEARIQAALGRLMQGKTVVVIAHRRSTIAGVDRVVSLRDGRIETPEEVRT